MPAVSTMKQDTSDDDDVTLLDDVHRQPPSPAPFYPHQFAVVDDVQIPRRDVIGNMLSRDPWSRPTSGCVTSQPADKAEPHQTTVAPRPPTKLLNASTSPAAAVSSSALVSSPETGWRAISGSGMGGLWERPRTHTAVSSPADAEPADVSLIAASPTVGRTPRLNSDSGSRSSDPLATLMRLYGTLSDAGRVTSPERRLDNSPAAITSLPVPVLSELSGSQGGTSVPVNSDEYIMREFNEVEDDADGPAKSYVCHVCQYIGTSRSMYLNHMSEHFKHRCSLCGYMTSYAGRLKRHLEDCHMADDERPATTQRKPTIKRCRKCGFESTNLKLFYDHVRTHIRPERVLECPTASCPFVTEYRHHLELHLRNHLNSRPIRCPICPYRCAVSSMLASHLKSHTKVHRFRCSVCRFSSKFSNALKRHLLEKGHGRGYVLNPDGSIPEGGAVPFEPGSPTTRVRQKANASAKSATATTGTVPGTSEAQRKPTRSADVTSEVAFATGADIKAAIWTPPVVSSPELQAAAAARKTSWRPVATSEEQLPVKLSPPVLGTLPGAETQAVSMPPLPPPPPLMTSTSAAHRARSLYACTVCGLDAGGYVELARHMMTSHYSVMTSAPERQAAAAAAAAAATTPFKRRWQDDRNEPAATSWTPPPRLPPTSQLNSPARHPVDRREFLQPGFQASSMPVFHQPSPPTGWGSYRSLPPPRSTPFGSLSTLRAELDAMRCSDGPNRVRADETFSTSDHDLQRVKPARPDVVDVQRWTTEPTRVDSRLQWQKTKPSSEYVERAPIVSGLPLDLSTKISSPRHDQLLPASVQSEAKRSRRKGKAFKVDADRLNSFSREEDLAESDPVGKYSSVTAMSGAPWRISVDLDTGTAARARGSGASRQVPAEHVTGDRAGVTAPSLSRCEEAPWSGGTSGATAQQTAAATSMDGSRSSSSSSSSVPYHECRHCGLGFRDGELFAMHMDFHGRPDPFTCNFCGTATGNQVEFFLHVAHAPHNVRPVYVV